MGLHPVINPWAALIIILVMILWGAYQQWDMNRKK